MTKEELYLKTIFCCIVPDIIRVTVNSFIY